MIYLTADFGSTYTKLSAIDTQKGEILGTSSSFTTIEDDVMIGFNNALNSLKAQIGDFKYDELICCSSAAGGLKMVAIGLVPELTAKAARMAASSAGAKVIKTYSFEISMYEQEEIYEINPDLVLLCGGTDGGDKNVITSNAKRLAEINRNFSIVVAGNKVASYEIKKILSEAGKDFEITDNVMPEFNKLNIAAAKQCIKNIFIRKIIDAKGLGKIQALSKHKIIPTPLAVLNACELFSKGTKNISGIGEIMAIDLGGATTDVYSMSDGEPSIDNTMVKGIKEPYSKRSVEGDLGMRYSLSFLAEQSDIDKIIINTNTSEEDIKLWIEKCLKNPSIIAKKDSYEEKVERELAHQCISIAVERHCGTMNTEYTPMGQIYVLTGKDLTEVPYVIGIGGAIINSSNPKLILEGVKADNNNPMCRKPANPKYLIDKKYIFASMGLLSSIEPETALNIMKKEITQII